VPYCSLGCYRSDAHGACSETFYKDEMVAALRGKTASADEKRQMMGVLQRLEMEERERREEEEEEEEEARRGGGARSWGLVAGRTADATDVGEENVPDLADRLAGVDLEDDAALAQLWDLLTPAELADFRKLVGSEAAGHLLPQWLPWWEAPPPRPVVIDTTRQTSDGDGGLLPLLSDATVVPPLAPAMAEQAAVAENEGVYVASPPTLLRLPSLQSLLGNKPPALQLPANLVELILAYCYVARILNGSLQDDVVASVSLMGECCSVLSEGAVHADACAAVHTFRARVLASATAAGSNEQTLQAVEDAAALLASDLSVQRALADALAVTCLAHASVAPVAHTACVLASIGSGETPADVSVTSGAVKGRHGKVDKAAAKIFVSMERRLLFYGSWWDWSVLQPSHAATRESLRAVVQGELEQFSRDNAEVATIKGKLQQQWKGQRPPARNQSLITELS